MSWPVRTRPCVVKWTDAQGAKHERAFDDFAGAGRAFERELLENGAKDTAVYGWDDEGGARKARGCSHACR